MPLVVGTTVLPTELGGGLPPVIAGVVLVLVLLLGGTVHALRTDVARHANRVVLPRVVRPVKAPAPTAAEIDAALDACAHADLALSELVVVAEVEAFFARAQPPAEYAGAKVVFANSSSVVCVVFFAERGSTFTSPALNAASIST
jgi:hypothetical protein